MTEVWEDGVVVEVYTPGLIDDIWVEEGPKGDPGDDGEDGADGALQTIVPGNNIDVDNTDPANPVISVEALTAGDISGLATVAATGVYADLTSKPTLGTAAAKNVGAASGDVAAGDRGLPTGGSSGQTLVKASGTNYDVGWTTPSAASGAPLAVVTRTATGAATYTTTSVTNADVDATNLAITFTVPSSGNVMVFLSGCCGHDTLASSVAWSLRSSTTNVPGTARTATSVGKSHVRMGIRLTGLTPGASVTYKWAWRSTVAGDTGTLYYGNSSSEFSATTPVGPLVMEVYAA